MPWRETVRMWTCHETPPTARGWPLSCLRARAAACTHRSAGRRRRDSIGSCSCLSRLAPCTRAGPLVWRQGDRADVMEQARRRSCAISDLRVESSRGWGGCMPAGEMEQSHPSPEVGLPSHQGRMPQPRAPPCDRIQRSLHPARPRRVQMRLFPPCADGNATSLSRAHALDLLACSQTKVANTTTCVTRTHTRTPSHRRKPAR